MYIPRLRLYLLRPTDWLTDGDWRSVFFNHRKLVSRRPVKRTKRRHTSSRYGFRWTRTSTASGLSVCAIAHSDRFVIWCAGKAALSIYRVYRVAPEKVRIRCGASAELPTDGITTCRRGVYIVVKFRPKKKHWQWRTIGWYWVFYARRGVCDFNRHCTWSYCMGHISLYCKILKTW